MRLVRLRGGVVDRLLGNRLGAGLLEQCQIPIGLRLQVLRRHHVPLVGALSLGNLSFSLLNLRLGLRDLGRRLIELRHSKRKLGVRTGRIDLDEQITSFDTSVFRDRDFDELARFLRGDTNDLSIDEGIVGGHVLARIKIVRDTARDAGQQQDHDNDDCPEALA